MSVQITYFVHGTTTDNEKLVSSGWYDVDLSELGIQQSIELKDKIKDKKFDVVFCSDLKRAAKSAELAFKKDDVEIIQDKRLRECNYGDYNAKSSEIVEPMQEKNITNKFPNGESYVDVEKRLRELLEELADQFSGQRLAFVAHQAPQLALEVICHGKSWPQAIKEDWRQTNSWRPGWEYFVK